MYVHKQFMKAIERFKQLVEQRYKEPVNGQFEDCTKEVSCRKTAMTRRTKIFPQNIRIVKNN